LKGIFIVVFAITLPLLAIISVPIMTGQKIFAFNFADPIAAQSCTYRPVIVAV
jgi:ABC-type sugar transport system permease subunit